MSEKPISPLRRRMSALADLLLHRALPSQRGYRRRPLARRNRSPGPGSESGLHQMRYDRRGRAAELERMAPFGKPDRRSVEMMCSRIGRPTTPDNVPGPAGRRDCD
jgi:hypothetical protein